MSIREEHLEAVAAALKPIIEDTFWKALMEESGAHEAELGNPATESPSDKENPIAAYERELLESCGLAEPSDEAFTFDEYETIPGDAELFFDDGEYAFRRTPDGTIFVSESLSDEVEVESVDIKACLEAVDEVADALDHLRDMLRRLL